MKSNNQRKHNWKKVLLLFASILPFSVSAAPLIFRSEGKIYVVVGVIIIIFAGIIAFLVRLDRRIQIMEDSNKK